MPRWARRPVFDDVNYYLVLMASRGFSRQAREFFDTVRRKTNSGCATAPTPRVRAFCREHLHQPLYVNSPELDALTDIGGAPVQSIPLTNSTVAFGRVLKLIVVNRSARRTSTRPLDRLAVRVADRFEQLELSFVAEHELASSPPHRKPTWSIAGAISFARSMLRELAGLRLFPSQAEEYKLLTFVSGGINRGQRAFHVLPAQHKKDHLQRSREAGIDVGDAMKGRLRRSHAGQDRTLQHGC